MQQVIEAIYENGVFRPLKTLELLEGQEVQLIVRSKNQIEPSQMLELAAEVYKGPSAQQIQDMTKHENYKEDTDGNQRPYS